MRVLDLFSGIGGFSLGLERAGMRTVAFCEIEPYCRAVLAKHWPDIPCYGDIRELNANRLASDGIAVDLICGGFPCQDISLAGKGAGLAGSRSGLWSEYARLIGELRPRYVIVENVAALLSRGLAEVLGDLATIRYDAEWHCIPASYVGAPHRRDRIWIIAYPDSQGEHAGTIDAEVGSASKPMADSEHPEWGTIPQSRGRVARERSLPPGEEGSGGLGGRRADVADPGGPREGDDAEALQARQSEPCDGSEIQYAANDPENGARIRRHQPSWDWRTEPSVGRVAHGIPSRVDRLKALGNAVVPQIPEIIGRAIMKQLSDKSSGDINV